MSKGKETVIEDEVNNVNLPMFGDVIDDKDILVRDTIFFSISRAKDI